MIYPKGTPVIEVKRWDRSTKAAFHCTVHPDVVWHSKQPGCSSWFANDMEAVPCGCQLNHFVLAEEYQS